MNSEEINVGDFVEVTDKGEVYDYYNTWALAKGLTGFVEGAQPIDGRKYKVIVQSKHLKYDYHLLGIEDASGKQFIIGVEGVKKIKSSTTLPKKFIMKSKDTSWLTTLVGDTYLCEATVSKFQYGPYTKEYLIKLIEDSRYTIEPIEEANGVDGEGKPFNFTKGHLKPFMRVKTKNGMMWVVVPNVQLSGDKESNDSNDEYVLSRAAGWNEFYTDANEKYPTFRYREIDEAYTAVEVYDLPSLNYDMINTDVVGDLIWKANEEIPNVENKEKPVENNFEQRLKHIENTLAGVNAKIANLQRNNTLYR